jgi:tetratricopeptide (TPR) repeat protein
MNRKQRRAENKQARSVMRGASPSIQKVFADAFGHYRVGRLNEAERLYRQVLAVDPRHTDSLHMLGVIAFQVGRYDLAIDLIGKAIGINPKEASYHSNLGAALTAQGKLDEAVACCRMALELKPDFSEAHTNLGVALKAEGKLDEAVTCYRTALQLKPNYPATHNYLGNALRDQRRLDEAVACYRKALALKPDYADAHNNLGAALADQGKLDEAVACCRTALELKPDIGGAYLNLCGIYERQNRLDDCDKVLEAAKLHCGENNKFLLRRAQLSFRRKKFGEALEFLGQVQVGKLRIISSYFNLLGKTYENLERFDEAFAAFEQQNKSASVSLSVRKYNADIFFERIKRLRDSWRSGSIDDWSEMYVAEGDPTLAFLIGFPRSGTTLLDSILRSHPNVSVVEEKPMVQRMKVLLGNIETPDVLNSLTRSQILKLREAYLNELSKNLGDLDRNKVVIDKLPLNITSVGLIHRVFPKAKFIFALRHPYDCVLSCFFQNFELNEAMANFLSLTRSAELYAAVMELWQGYVDRLNLDFSTLRYESLTQDLKGTVAPVIQSLDLEWHENLLNYQDTARKRTSISTPSYSQVVEPLYQRAIGRWRNYTKQISVVEPILQPWIDEFGY